MYQTFSTLLMSTMDFSIRPQSLYTVSALSKLQRISDRVMFMKSLFRFVLLTLHIMLSAGLGGGLPFSHCLYNGYSPHPCKRM